MYGGLGAWGSTQGSFSAKDREKDCNFDVSKMNDVRVIKIMCAAEFDVTVYNFKIKGSKGTITLNPVQ